MKQEKLAFAGESGSAGPPIPALPPGTALLEELQVASRPVAPTRSFSLAAKRYQRRHAIVDLPKNSGKCPACAHDGCCGEWPENPGKAFCFSQSHEGDSGGCGTRTEKGWVFGSLDLNAKAAALTPRELLHKQGYLLPVAKRPTILVKEGEYDKVADAATAALAENVEGLFEYGDELVVVSEGTSTGTAKPELTINALDLHQLIDLLTKVADFRRWARTKLIACQPPNDVARIILARKNRLVPRLRRTTRSPVLLSDGTVLQDPGFEPLSGILYDPGETVFPEVPEKPTKEDASAALIELCGLLSDFPFTTEYDRAAALAAILTVLGREAIDGYIPMFLVDAPKPGAGKTLLVDVIAILGTGRSANRYSGVGTEDEQRKRIVAIGRAGHLLVSFDNLNRLLESAALCTILTADTFSDRLLGADQDITVPVRFVVFATGNNIRVSDELIRRSVPVHLDAVEPGRNFKHPDLLAWVESHRPRLVVAALSVLRAYMAARRPAPTDLAPLDSFKAWTDLVRGTLQWLGLPDPLGGADEGRQQVDPTVEAFGSVLLFLYLAWADKPFLVQDIVRLARDEIDLRTDLQTAAQTDQKIEGAALGQLLNQFKDRPIYGLTLRRTKRTNQGYLWTIEADST